MVKGKSEVCHVRPVGPFRFRPDICWSMFLEQCRSRFGEAARPTFVVVHTPASYANGSGTQTQLNQPCELVHAFVDSQKSRTRQTSCLGHCSTQVKVPPTSHRGLSTDSAVFVVKHPDAVGAPVP